MSDLNVNFKFSDTEIPVFFTALTAVLIPLGRLLTVLADLIEAIKGAVPQMILYMSAIASLANNIGGNLIVPLRNLFTRTESTLHCIEDKKCGCRRKRRSRSRSRCGR